jgi:hypothetical protein
MGNRPPRFPRRDHSRRGSLGALSFKVLYAFLTGQAEVFNAPVYTWMTVGLKMEVGFLVDS